MKTSGRHTVRTICFDLTTQSEELIQSCINTIRCLNLEESLMDVLDDFCLDKKIVRIESLQLDLGINDFQDQKILNEAVRRELASRLRLHQVASYNLNPKQSVEISKKAQAMSVDTNQYRLEIFLYFLEHGVLPWQAKELNKNRLNELIEDGSDELRMGLVKVLDKLEAAIRLAQICDERNFERLVKLLYASDQVEVTLHISALVRHFAGKKKHPHIFDEFAALTLQGAVQKFSTASQILKDFFGYLNSVFPDLSIVDWRREVMLTPGATRERLIDALNDSAKYTLRNYSTKAMSESPDGKSSISNSSERSTSGDLVLSREKECLKFNERSQQEIPKDRIGADMDIVERFSTRKKDKSDDDFQQPIYLSNAGLVLLNAGLIQDYFQQLHWVKEKKFVSENAKSKAIKWLHYLVEGDGSFAEYKAALNKILVGMDVSNICNVRVRLSAKERKAGDELLVVVIEHWSALKQTSKEVLQQTFLQRNGRLQMENGIWSLHVESKAYDILIDRLPWSFSIIRFPWMTKPLFTQWLTQK